MVLTKSKLKLPPNSFRALCEEKKRCLIKVSLRGRYHSAVLKCVFVPFEPTLAAKKALIFEIGV